MKYVLVDNGDNINTSVELESEVGVSGAKTYFKGVKNMPSDEAFDSLWKVMTERDYNKKMKISLRKPSSYGIEWWKDDEDYLDIDK